MQQGMTKTSCETVNDEYWIRKALVLAEKAGNKNEVPVGAVLISDDKVIGTGYNKPIATNDPTSHAELIAIRAGAAHRNNYRLTGTTMYVTLEPCIMCMGAIIHARIERLVFGAFDRKTGAACSIYSIGNDNLLNHRLKITGGILEQPCSELLKAFFREKRLKNKNHAK